MSKRLRNIATVIGAPSSDTISRVERTLCPDLRVHDSINQNLEFAGDLDSPLGLCFSLKHPNLAVADIPFVHQSSVGHSLAGQIGKVHGVLKAGIGFIVNAFEQFILNVRVPARLFIALDASAWVGQRRVALISGVVPYCAEQPFLGLLGPVLLYAR